MQTKSSLRPVIPAAVILFLAICAPSSWAQTPPQDNNSAQDQSKPGLRNKKVPLIVVVDKTKAEFEISGVSESEKAGWAKMLFVGSQNSNEEASIKISNLKTGAVIFGYSVHKTNSVRGRQSAGEACAKHIKQIVLD